MNRPLLYMDVDGVINAWAARGDHPENFELTFAAVAADGRGYPMRVPVGTRERVGVLQARFEIVWATTWAHDAVRVLAPQFGFGGDWPVLELDGVERHPLAPRPRMSGPHTPKLSPILHHAGDRPLVWVDDEMTRDAMQAISRRNRDVAPSLIVKPKPAGGLADRHMRHLIAFADAHTTA